MFHIYPFLLFDKNKGEISPSFHNEFNDTGKLNNLIIGYLNLIKPNLFGENIPEDDFQRSLQMGVSVINWLERLNKLFDDKGHFTSYTEDDIKKYYPNSPGTNSSKVET